MQSVMLNLFQHLIKSMHYETLNRIQGDKRVVFQQPVRHFFTKGKCPVWKPSNGVYSNSSFYFFSFRIRHVLLGSLFSQNNYLARNGE